MTTNLLTEQEIIQTLLFSSQPDSSEKLRLFLEYLKMKRVAAEGQAGEGEAVVIQEPPLRSVVTSTMTASTSATTRTNSTMTANNEKRGPGRPRLSSTRVTVSCKPSSSLRSMQLGSHQSLTQQAPKRRGRPPKRRGPIKPLNRALPERSGLERLAESAAEVGNEVGVEIEAEADAEAESDTGAGVGSS